jgi:formylglycine-generating enzyme required for sulfatase activity
MIFRNIFFISTLLTISGCATVASDNTQPVSVSTTGCPGAKCILRNNDGVSYVTTPGTVLVDKDYADLNVSCKHDDYQDIRFSGSWESKTGGWVFGNILIGGLIGVGIDVISGNAYEYPNSILIPMDCGTKSEARAVAKKLIQEPTPPQTSTSEEKQIKIDINKNMTLGPHEMVFVEGGCFMMGSEIGAPDRGADENLHKICVTGFLIDRHEVTFDSYSVFAKETGRRLPDDLGFGRGSRPVLNITWHDAEDYASWASSKYGINFRLPTEAEWEYACRGSGSRAKYCGSSDPNEVAVFSAPQTRPVGSKKPNDLGIYDMSGNVAEMTCSPYYDRSMGNFTSANYTGLELTCSSGDLVMSTSTVSRVLRGGGWDSSKNEIRAAARHYNIQSTLTRRLYPRIIKSFGFRLVATTPNLYN